MLNLLVEYATHLAESNKWAEVALARARYLRVYRLATLAPSPDRPIEQDLPLVGAKMGDTVAKMHFLAKLRWNVIKGEFFPGRRHRRLARAEQHHQFND